MKLELTEGCVCDSFEVDGNPIKNCDESQLKYMLILATQKICCKPLDENGKASLKDILCKMVENFYDTCESDKTPCECCGDYVETYTMEI